MDGKGRRFSASKGAHAVAKPPVAGSKKAHAARRAPMHPSFSPQLFSLKAPRALLAALGAFVLVSACICWYVTMLRPIAVKVNGQEVGTRIHTSVEDLLRANDYFGAQPGRLLSVGGNVLDERGGDRCAVSIDDDPLVPASFAQTEVEEGASLTVGNGADRTESYTKGTAPVAPGIQMDSGGAVQYVSQWGKAGERTVWHGRQSGETADKDIIEPARDMIVASVNVKPKGNKKCLALTFDDGPSAYTQQILDILKDKGAKATFYNLGINAAANPALAKAVRDGGHELASHTNRHQQLPTLGRDDLRAEISSAADAIEQASGARPQMIRAPYGAFTATEWARSADLVGCNVLWNIDTLDWKRPGADAIVQQVVSQAFNGAIVLMHDGGGNREQDVEALPRIIDELHEAGYELVTVSELMRRDDSIPKDVAEGTVKMPKDAALPEM